MELAKNQTMRWLANGATKEQRDLAVKAGVNLAIRNFMTPDGGTFEDTVTHLNELMVKGKAKGDIYETVDTFIDFYADRHGGDEENHYYQEGLIGATTIYCEILFRELGI